MDGAPQEPGQLRRTWGTTELSRAFSDAHCTGKGLSPTDRLLVTELYGMCHWPDVPAPPAAATTFPMSYAFVAMRIGLRRSGAERAVERLRERGWVSTELDDESGYLIYTVHIGKILKDLESWGRWSIRDAIGSRAPSRRGRPGRSERWGHAARPQHLRRRPRAMPIAELVDRWRGVWPEAPDPTATLATLLQEGATPRQLHRALDSIEQSGLSCPKPEYIRDRHERAAYRDGGPPEAAAEEGEPEQRTAAPAGPWAPPAPTAGDELRPNLAGDELRDVGPEVAGAELVDSEVAGDDGRPPSSRPRKPPPTARGRRLFDEARRALSGGFRRRERDMDRAGREDPGDGGAT